MPAYEKLEMLIDGEWTQGSASNTQPVENPATQEVLAQVPMANTQDLDDALSAVEKGFAKWRATPAFERQIVMERAADLMVERRDAIAKTCTMEMGKPFIESQQEIDFAIGITRWYAEEGKRAYGRIIPSRAHGVRNLVLKEPVGPVVAFVAWNFPAVNFIRKVAGALGAGCSIIVKPSEETPGTAVGIGRCFQDAGLPAGVLNIVFGAPAEVSQHLLASKIPKKMSFTGSVPVGILLQKQAAETLKRCTLELGGHAPFIVCDDADVDLAAKLAAAFKYRNAGQVCTSPSRFFVHDAVHDEFIGAMGKHMDAISVGNGLDSGTTMGPLFAKRRIEVMEKFISDATDRGAKVVKGGNRIGNNGWFFEPTLLDDVEDDALIMREEQFGPVAPVTRFDNFDDAITRANNVDVGLAAYAFTKSSTRAYELADRLDTGLVGINSTTLSLPETPFGGANQSGYGSEGGIEGLDTFLRTKMVSEAR